MSTNNEPRYVELRVRRPASLWPLARMLAPGLWRNVCPMAAVNQIPRVFGMSRGARLPGYLERHGYAVGLLLFLALASSRKAGLSSDAQAVAIVLGSAML